MDPRQEQLRQRLGALGFDAARFASVAAPIEGGLTAWLGAGMQADMNWMQRSAEKRLDPQLVLPGAKSIVMLGVNYWSGEPGAGSRGAGPIWARYALHEDYHDTVKPGLVAAGK